MNAVLRVLDRCLQPLGLQMTAAWRTQWWTAAQSFCLGDREYRCFYHTYNCGWPPYATERCVELALADAWLESFQPNDVVEVGAVTPYYWPYRIGQVVDPFDPHPLVTDRKSIFEVDLRGRAVLSLSTFEHIGTDDYGTGNNGDSPSATSAFKKLFAESSRFLVTVPTGYNTEVDELLFARDLPLDVSLRFVVRDGDGAWREGHGESDSRRPYGDKAICSRYPETSIGRWANSVAVLERSSTSTAAVIETIPRS